MATAGIVNNIEAVRTAIRLYGERLKRDVHEETKKKMADIAYRSAEATPFGDKDRLRAEISNLPITKDGGKRRYGNTQYVGQYKLINWERKQKGLLPLGNSRFRKVTKYIVKPGAMSVQEKTSRRRNQVRAGGPSLRANPFMDGKYKSFIQSRIRSIKFIRAAWGVAAAFFSKGFKRGEFGPETLARFSGKQYGGGDIKQVGDSLAEYSIFNNAGRYDTRYKKRGQDTAPERSAADQSRAENIIETALQKGIQAVLVDITQYFEKRAARFQSEIRILNKFK